MIQEEMLATRGDGRTSRATTGTPEAEGRWSRWLQRVNDLLYRLVDRGDAMAHHLAVSEEPYRVSTNCSPLFPMALSDRLFAGAMTLIIVCYWMLG